MSERPQIERGARVSVAEDGITPWSGTVTGLKPSGDAWRIEVRRDDGNTWSVPESFVNTTGPGECPHGFTEDHEGTAGTNEVSSCCGAQVTYSGDGELYCKCCYGSVEWVV
jgi:hypothetical protein